MNKKLIVASVVAALTAPVASYAVDATLYGSIRAGLVSGDSDGADSNRRLDLGGTGNDGTLNGQGLYSRIGVNGSSDLGNGLSAGLHLERGVGSGALTTRHTNVWISGGFGRLTFGQQGNPYRNARHWDQNWFLGGQFSTDGGTRVEGINYSMSSGPFSLNVMATANDVAGTVTEGTTVHYFTSAPVARGTEQITDAAGGNHVGAGAPLGLTLDADGDVAATQPTAVCTVASATCALGYTIDSGVAESNLTRVGGEELDDSDGVDSWVLHAGYDFGVVALNVAHETNETDALTARSNTAVGLNGSVGPVGWYLSYQTSELENAAIDNDIDSWGGFISFAASDSDIIYGYHVSHSADRAGNLGTTAASAVGEDFTETILGYSHNFGGGVSLIAEYLTVDKDLASGTAGNEPDTLVLAMKVDF